MNYELGGRLHSEAAERLHTSPSRHSDSRPRFTRHSPYSNRTSPSRSSEDSHLSQKFIKLNKITRAQLDPDDFFQGFSTEYVRQPDQEPQEDANSLKKYARSRENSQVRLKTMERELGRRAAEAEQMRRENGRLREALDREIDKRRQLEKTLKTNTIMLSELQRKCREDDVGLAALTREVRLLEDKRFNKDERALLSCRERALMEEINRLRLLPAAHPTLHFLERENRRLAAENEQLRGDNNYLKIGQRTVAHRLVHFQKQLKLAIRLEEEFFELRRKYEELARKERTQRRELEQLRQRLHPEEPKAESLSFSSSSGQSLAPRTLLRAKQHHSRRPNGS